MLHVHDWIDIEKINWDFLSQNNNDLALEMLKQKPKKINWFWLSLNNNDLAIEMLKQKPKK